MFFCNCFVKKRSDYVKDLMFARSLNQVLADYLLNHPGLVVKVDTNNFYKYDSVLGYFFHCQPENNFNTGWHRSRGLETISGYLGNVNLAQEDE